MNLQIDNVINVTSMQGTTYLYLYETMSATVLGFLWSVACQGHSASKTGNFVMDSYCG